MQPAEVPAPEADVITQALPETLEEEEQATPQPRGLLASLCWRCCGRPPDVVLPPEAALQSRTLYIPPAPHTGPPFIPERLAEDAGRKTLVLDLDETLVHSSFKPVANADFIIPVEIDGRMTDVYVLKRPWVDHFLREVAARFEVVVFTASLAKYADPLLDLLDTSSCVRWRLFRESCYPFEGNYVKDLTCLGRPLRDCIIVDNSPHSYLFQPFNAVPVRTWIDDPSERDLLELLPQLIALADVEDVTPVIADTYLEGITAVFQD